MVRTVIYIQSCSKEKRNPAVTLLNLDAGPNVLKKDHCNYLRVHYPSSLFTGQS